MTMLKQISILSLVLPFTAGISAHAQEHRPKQMTITKYDNTQNQDGVIKIDGTKVTSVDNENIRFEVITHKSIGLKHSLSKNRPVTAGKDANLRKLGRANTGGFSVKWEKTLHLKNQGHAGHGIKLKGGTYYIAVDTDNDQRAETVYKIYVDPGDQGEGYKKGSTIYGVAKTKDGSALTPLSVAYAWNSKEHTVK